MEVAYRLPPCCSQLSAGFQVLAISPLFNVIIGHPTTDVSPASLGAYRQPPVVLLEPHELFELRVTRDSRKSEGLVNPESLTISELCGDFYHSEVAFYSSRV